MENQQLAYNVTAADFLQCNEPKPEQTNHPCGTQIQTLYLFQPELWNQKHSDMHQTLMLSKRTPSTVKYPHINNIYAIQFEQICEIQDTVTTVKLRTFDMIHVSPELDSIRHIHHTH